MITVSIIGRPNVGKSSLFNVLTRKKDALVSDFPGVTRDRHYAKIELEKNFYLIVDTGGLDFNSYDDINFKMAEQTQLAIDESDIILFVVDARSGLTASDESIALELRKKNKKTLLLINKAESLNPDEIRNDFYKLGYADQILISTSHNQNINLINDYLNNFLINQAPQELLEDVLEKKSLVLSVLGKPNVGKSTLINKIIGEDRFIAFDQPGTTRDSVSVDTTYKGNLLTIIDTAGIRKKGRVDNSIEKFSILKSLLSIINSNVSILVIDGSEGLSSQDLQIFSYIIEQGNPCVIAVNKWDLLDSYKKELLKNSINKKINIFKNYKIKYISALENIGINSIIDEALKAYNSSILKVPTSLINKFLIDLQVNHQPPIYKGIRPKLKFMHQGGICPPTFIIHGNHLNGLRKDYLSYIESALIATFKIMGSPIKITLKESENPFEILDKKIKRSGLVTRRKQINEKRQKIRMKKN
jgi:GTP-binding protein